MAAGGEQLPVRLESGLSSLIPRVPGLRRGWARGHRGSERNRLATRCCLPCRGPRRVGLRAHVYEVVHECVVEKIFEQLWRDGSSPAHFAAEARRICDHRNGRCGVHGKGRTAMGLGMGRREIRRRHGGGKEEVGRVLILLGYLLPALAARSASFGPPTAHTAHTPHAQMGLAHHGCDFSDAPIGLGPRLGSTGARACNTSK